MSREAFKHHIIKKIDKPKEGWEGWEGGEIAKVKKSMIEDIARILIGEGFIEIVEARESKDTYHIVRLSFYQGGVPKK